MTHRSYCHACGRLQSLCLCAHISAIDNAVSVLILQHPNESGHPKNTAQLTHACLLNSRLEVGEQFDEPTLQSWLSPQSWLLYPSTDDFSGSLVSSLTEANRLSNSASTSLQVVVLDGTWKKTRKMLYLNPVLANLPRVSFAGAFASGYRIRKQKSQGLSTLEAIQLALRDYENAPNKYVPLQKVFDALMTQHEAFKKM